MLIPIIILVILALGAIVVLRRRGRSTSPTSIVMLRPTPRRFSEADVRAAYRRVFKKEPQVEKIPMPDGLTNGFLLLSEELPPIAVIDSTRGYMEPDEAADVAKNLEHPAARAAMTDHKAWVSVDAMGSIGFKKEQRTVAYALLAPLAAELYDDGVLLLYLPAEGRIARPGSQVEQMLRDNKIAELFDDADLHAPMVHVESEDAEINKAMAEAQRRLPEFLAAFERMGPATEAPAMFKARFPTSDTDNRAEYIWLKLAEIGDKDLVGTIENPPIDKSIPAKGSTARVPLERVVDWIYMDERKEPQGLFVDRILIRRGRKR